jgi:integrase
VSDVTKRGGVDVIIVRESEEDDKRVKSESGERFVPVHPELVRIGLLDYRDGMAAQGEKWLFPELPAGVTGYRSDRFSKWFRRYLVNVKATARRTSFLSFRHNYRDALREADISTERVRALGGWSNGSVEENYGAGLSAAALAAAIAKVRYGELDLSHLVTVD